MTKMHLPPPVETPPQRRRWGPFILVVFVFALGLAVAVGAAVVAYTVLNLR
jgi:hypothetical protein